MISTCTCDRYGSDGAACQAATGCEWSWSQNKCTPVQGSCESIRTDGQTCSVTPGCEWDWDHGCCKTSENTASERSNEGPCQRIGSDGATCSQTDGCVWDWDLSSCIASKAQQPAIYTGKPSGKKINGSRTSKDRKSARGSTRRRRGTKSTAVNACAKLNVKRCA